MATFLEFAKENADGWSLVAVRASLDRVTPLLRGDALVLEYQSAVQPRVVSKRADGLSYDEDGKMAVLTPVPGRRTCFVVRPRGSEWCVLFRTIYWVELEDSQWVQDVARDLSARLATTAVASCGGDHGLLCHVCESGEVTRKLGGFDRKKVARVFDTLGISVPLCFIGGSPPALLAAAEVIGDIEQADRLEVRVPAA